MAGLGLSVLSINNLRLELAGGHVAMLNVEGFPLERQGVCRAPERNKAIAGDPHLSGLSTEAKKLC